VAARSKAWVCGCSLAGISVSNPTGGMGVLPVVNVVCCTGRGLCDGPIPIQEIHPSECVCVCVCFTECDQVQR
jgi:hypothetical protein